MADVNTIVTEKITEALEAGTCPWRKPWTAAGPPRNLHSGKPYRGMNTVLLSLTPYASPYWLTLKQANERGGRVKRGETSSLVVFWKFRSQRTEENEAGEKVTVTEERERPILRYYRVFNSEQCEGLEVPPLPDVEPREHTPLAACEAILAGMPQRPPITRDPRQAWYSPTADRVGIPAPEQFGSGEEFYSVLFHELTHATGHPSRLGRKLDAAPAPFGSAEYSREELVAEFGAAFLCWHAGISPAVLENQAAYLDGWLKKLRSDKRLLPIAAAQAQRAADFILARSAGG